MARKPEGNSTTGTIVTGARSADSSRNLRNQIDKLDLQILKLVNDRANVAGKIGRLKNDQGEEVFSPAREEEILKNVLEVNTKHNGPLDAATVRSIFREIMSGTRALQKTLKVAYLGPEHSFSHLAAVERFGHAVDFVSVGSVATVFEEVSRGHADFGVVPLENSSDGRVADTLDSFRRMPDLVISAEVRLQIHHNLLANCEQAQIRRVYSKGQALSECRNWLSKNVPQAVLVEVSSTADAARLAQTEPGAAAVASKQIAVRYGLRVLFTDLEESPCNEARFAVIGAQKSGKTGHDKTTITFRLPHKTGTLVEALGLFEQAKINLTRIESFPAKTAKPEYMFLVDFEGHTEDPKVAKMLKALAEHSQEVTVLGSFPTAEVAG